MSPPSAARAFPRPGRTRWQPLRSGFLNIYKYDEQEFLFEDGHLLLRGHNGTGKSRVLALQLPFLFDGEIVSHRLEPDEDPAKKIDWNLLMGKYQDRLGYTWLELGRRDEDGREHFVTLGCGLHAVAGAGLRARWFFITTQRINQDLSLSGELGQPLGREALAEAVGERGKLYSTATDYRAAVDQKLFRLGKGRYEALVNLLIQLRRPQLSRALDEKKLSQALSDALPPVPREMLEDVADSFRGLEEDRLALDGYTQAARSVEAFLVDYQGHVRLGVKRRTAAVRLKHNLYENSLRSLRAAETDEKAAREEVAATETAIESLGLELAETEATLVALRAGPEMRAAQALEQADKLARVRREESERAGHRHAEATETLGRRQAEAERSRQDMTKTREVLDTRLCAAEQAAAASELTDAHSKSLGQLQLPDALASDRIPAVERQLEQALARKLEQEQHLRKLEDKRSAAQREHAAASSHRADRRTQLEESQERQRQARAGLERAADELAAAYTGWRGELAELRPPPLEEFGDALSNWCASGEGPSPLHRVVAQVRAAREHELAAVRASLGRQLAEQQASETELEARRSSLASGRHVPPPAPPTRAPEVRESAEGAPLWMLCDFAPEVDGQSRAGLEAALEAAGLLDAWVTPDGGLLRRGEHDTALTVAGELAPSGRRLAELLVPASERQGAAAKVPDETIRALCSRIGVGEDCGPVWIDASGRWRVGPLAGEWAKPQAVHLGESAREAERLRMLAALGAELERLRSVLGQTRAELDDNAQRSRRVRSEAESLPDDRAVRQAQAALEAAAVSVAQDHRRLEEAERALMQRSEALRQALEARDAAARDLGLERWLQNLDSLREALATYRRALASLWPTLHLYASKLAALARSEALVAEASQSATLTADALARSAREAAEARAAHDTLRATVGASVDELLRRLSLQEARKTELDARREAAWKARSTWAGRLGKAAEEVKDRSDRLQRAEDWRAEAIAYLRTCATSGLLGLAVPELSAEDPAGWSVTRAVELARRADAALAGSPEDDAAWSRSKSSIWGTFKSFDEALRPHDFEPAIDWKDEICLVTAAYRGSPLSVPGLAAFLADEIAHRQSLLSAQERQILENHLMGEVARHLQERLHEAREWVRNMNRELEKRPTSTGMALRFQWEPDEQGPSGLQRACKLLLKAGMLSGPERETVGTFLQQQIDAERAAAEGATWQEHLSRALDYRAWHVFSVQRMQDGQWKTLNRRTHGTGSGGEKAIALTMPQFAAAAAHYESADAKAPRLILLDEVFVGIDEDMRAKCMGLLATFELDFIMTSEREWGCYPTLPGVSIYQLSTRPEVDAVHASHWVWNGRQRVKGEEPAPRTPRRAEGPEAGQTVIPGLDGASEV